MSELQLSKISRDQKRRFIILTDMENEPDDSQTMVKLLLYSNEIDIEAMIAVTSCWLQDEVFETSIVDRIHAYGIVRPNLMKHADGWPTVQELLDITAPGQIGFGMDAVGEGKSSAGSELIIKAMLKDDDRPVYFSINAGGNTLAQALFDMRVRLTPEVFAKAAAKIRILDDSGQDNCGAWINQEFPEIFYVRNSPQVYGLFGPDLNMGPQPWEPLNQYEWAEKNVRCRHGILGALYPQRIIRPSDKSAFPKNVVGLFFWFMDGGGTTGVLHVLNTGLSDPDEITWGGWGGRFLDKKCKIYAGESAHDPENGCGGSNSTINEDIFEWNNMYPSARDSWYDEEAGVQYDDNIFVPLWRFRKDILLDFQARMDWCVDEKADANHHPVACVNGDDGERCILGGTVKAGQQIDLDASASHDPDGDNISFRWWTYPEASTYQGAVDLGETKQPQLSFQIPQDAKAGETIHVVLEVFDDSKVVSLKSYRRIVLTIAE